MTRAELPISALDSACGFGHSARVPAPRFIVVTGLPGSGKTTLARQVGDALGMPVLDKDDFLERLFPEGASVLPEQRSLLSRQADEEFKRAALDVQGAVLVSFWRRVELSATSGTPTDWLSTLPGMIEVFCDCSAETASRRFRNRTRHAAHGDSSSDDAQQLSRFRALRRLGPLGLTAVVVVSTEHAVNIDDVVAMLRTGAYAVDARNRTNAAAAEERAHDEPP